LIGTHPAISISETVEVLKTESAQFIRDQRFTSFQFSWQTGFGAFSHSKSELDNVVRYILNQQEHHRKHSFRDEYLSLLRRFDVSFEEKYLFDFFDSDAG